MGIPSRQCPGVQLGLAYQRNQMVRKFDNSEEPPKKESFRRNKVEVKRQSLGEFCSHET